MPRHEVRLSRYRRAPTIATGRNIRNRSEIDSAAAPLIVGPTSSTSRTTVRTTMGTKKTTKAFTKPRRSSCAVP